LTRRLRASRCLNHASDLVGAEGAADAGTEARAREAWTPRREA
jgi:hypothetical protein